MATQFLPIVKAIAPYLAQVATAAIPAFTSRKENSKLDPIIAKQIEELQVAASQNAQSVHVLAEKLQLAIQNIETTAQQADRQIAIYKVVVFSAVSLSIVSLLLSIYAIMQ